MKIKKLILKISIAILVVFSPMLVMNESYAYWAGSITGASNTATGTVTVGEWIVTQEWDPNAIYPIGAIVIYNGIEYRSLRDGNNKVPGANGSGNWWAVN